MPSCIYEIFAEGRKIGIVVAENRSLAREAAHYATTRRTQSKIDVSCDYEGLVACELVCDATPMGGLQLLEAGSTGSTGDRYVAKECSE